MTGRKMHYVLLLWALLLTSSATAYARVRPTANQIHRAIDMNGVRAFWSVMETLQENREPSEERWRTLFETPGYAKLQQSDVQSNFRLAYMPSKAGELQIEIKRGDYRSRVLVYLGRVQNERDRIESFLNSFDAQDVIGAALQKCAAYLPKGATERRSLPMLAFVIFEPDGHVDDDVVIFDALYAIDRGNEFTDLLAHEFHHYYEPSKLRNPERSSEDYYIVHAVQQMQMEGIADLIDKRAYPIKADASRQWYIEQYNAAYLDSSKTLHRMDEVLCNQASSPMDIEKSEEKFWESLKFAGHPTGFYMANIILKYLSRRALIGTEMDPFEFFRVYNQAARKCGAQCYVFSDASMAALQALDLKYVK